MKKALLTVLICLFTVSFAFAQENGTAKEAQDLVAKAIAYYKAEGKDKAFAAISDPKGQFIKKDLYVFIGNLNGVVFANCANKALVGKNLYELNDSTLKQFTKEIMDGAKSKGKGWFDYSWRNPTTKKIERRLSYYYQMESDFVFICGSHKPKKSRPRYLPIG